MARKTVSKLTRSTTESKATKSRATAVHAKATPKPSKKPSARKKNVAVDERLDVIQAGSGSGALNKSEFPNVPISASAPVFAQTPPVRSEPLTEHAAEGKVRDRLGITARITGALLGLVTAAVVTPILALCRWRPLSRSVPKPCSSL